MIKNRAFFLDRDGVLIEEVNYLSDPEQVHIFPETFTALKLLQEHGFKIIVVTNQAGVARGYFSEKNIPVIHDEINRLLYENGVGVDAYYYCPHHPKGVVKEYSIECSCRKPEPGMILKAAEDFKVDLSRSFLIGDKVSDLLAGKKAGCKAGLVKTGHGLENVEKAEELNFPVFDNILAAVQNFLTAGKH